MSDPLGCTHELKFRACSPLRQDSLLASSFWFQVLELLLLMKPQISWHCVVWLGVQLQIHEDYFIADAASGKVRAIALGSCLCCLLLSSLLSLNTLRGLMYSQRNRGAGGMLLTV